MITIVIRNKEGVSMDYAVVLECTLATESTAEVRKEPFTKMEGLDV